MPVEKGQSLWSDAWRRLKKNRLAMVCLGLVVLFTLLAVYGEIVYQYHHAKDITPLYQMTNLDIAYEAPSTRHWMGTDGLGRDVMARLVQGVRIAYKVGIITSLIAIPIGVILGCLAGFFGGRVDDFIVWLYSTSPRCPVCCLFSPSPWWCPTTGFWESILALASRPGWGCAAWCAARCSSTRNKTMCRPPRHWASVPAGSCLSISCLIFCMS
ncbi:MAG: hypothetical protein KJN98_00215 [Pontiella sp.]|nr:hypothetical protein [Pontiella sp.]